MKKYNKEKGDLGEKIAVKFLENKRYIILEKNFKTKIGEIDLIIKDKNIIAFVEVKFRKNSTYGYPYEAVDIKKQRKIINVAKLYIKIKKLHNVQFRFDIVEIYKDDKKINHITNAFWL